MSPGLTPRFAPDAPRLHDFHLRDTEKLGILGGLGHRLSSSRVPMDGVVDSVTCESGVSDITQVDDTPWSSQAVTFEENETPGFTAQLLQRRLLPEPQRHGAQQKR